ncbi:MAG TPA: hypothetical protein VJT81_05225 [Burkholderiales bacterium]|nr:hypothetical protein [Burkholderiales bacterium]
MKLVKIKFTAWRDQPATPRSPEFQRKLDAWNQREHVLHGAAFRVRKQQATADSEVLKMQIGAITTELNNIQGERQPLIAAEAAEVEQAQATLLKHKRVGTFGYQVFNAAGTGVAKFVDASGKVLPARAVYAFEVVDTDPPLPEWASKKRAGTKRTNSKA